MIRGAITVGRHYINDQMIFSEALVEAYNIENATRQSRVVVSDTLKAFLTLESDFRLEKDTHSQERLRSASLFQNGYALRDPSDGELFLDYMNFMPAGDHIGYRRLVRHREWIIDGVADHKNDPNPNVSQKFEWMRDYHNEWCTIFEAHRDDLSDFMIGELS